MLSKQKGLYPSSFFRVNPNNIRQEIDKEFRDQLVASISKYGILVPFMSTKDGMVIAGNQRFECALKAGYLEFVEGKDFIFKKADSKEIDVINALENIMRKNLNFFEESDGLIRIMKEYHSFFNADEAYSQLNNYLAKNLSRENMKRMTAVIQTIESLGMTNSRALFLLSLDKIESKTRKYLIKRMQDRNEEGGRKIGLTKVYAISRIPRKDQLVVARGAIDCNLSSAIISRAYQQWLVGERNANFRYIGSKQQQTENMRLKASFAAREQAIKQIEKKQAINASFGDHSVANRLSPAKFSAYLKMFNIELDMNLNSLPVILKDASHQDKVEALRTIKITLETISKSLKKLEKI